MSISYKAWEPFAKKTVVSRLVVITAPIYPVVAILSVILNWWEFTDETLGVGFLSTNAFSLITSACQQMLVLMVHTAITMSLRPGCCMGITSRCEIVKVTDGLVKEIETMEAEMKLRKQSVSINTTL